MEIKYLKIALLRYLPVFTGRSITILSVNGVKFGIYQLPFLIVLIRPGLAERSKRQFLELFATDCQLLADF